MFHLQDVHLVGDGLGSVFGREWRTELSDDLTAIADGRDVVDGDTCLGIACGLDSFVDVVAPHAFSAVLGQ